MDAEFWQYAIPAGTGLIGTIVTVYFTSKATNKKVDEVSNKAEEAANLARPTGNGFANEVRQGLKDIREEQNRQALHIAKLDGQMGILSSLLAPPTRQPPG